MRMQPAAIGEQQVSLVAATGHRTNNVYYRQRNKYKENSRVGPLENVKRCERASERAKQQNKQQQQRQIAVLHWLGWAVLAVNLRSSYRRYIRT
jgi:hypothetical protein